MNFKNKKLLACAIFSISLVTQAQQNNKWNNDFSDASESLKTVGRGSCAINDEIRHYGTVHH